MLTLDKNLIFQLKLFFVLCSLFFVMTTDSLAAQSVGLIVSGTIRPPACNISIPTNGGVVDLGDINPATDLAATGETLLPVQELYPEINCSSVIKVAVEFLDNRADSVSPDISAPYAYGLGFDQSGTPIGGYRLRMPPSTFITNTGGLTHQKSTDGGQTWAYNEWSQAGWLYTSNGNQGSGPVAFQSATFKVEVYPYIAPKQFLDLSQEIVLDGSVTLSLYYL